MLPATWSHSDPARAHRTDIELTDADPIRMGEGPVRIEAEVPLVTGPAKIHVDGGPGVNSTVTREQSGHVTEDMTHHYASHDVSTKEEGLKRALGELLEW